VRQVGYLQRIIRTMLLVSLQFTSYLPNKIRVMHFSFSKMSVLYGWEQQYFLL